MYVWYECLKWPYQPAVSLKPDGVISDGRVAQSNAELLGLCKICDQVRVLYDDIVLVVYVYIVVVELASHEASMFGA